MCQKWHTSSLLHGIGILVAKATGILPFVVDKIVVETAFRGAFL